MNPMSPSRIYSLPFITWEFLSDPLFKHTAYFMTDYGFSDLGQPFIYFAVYFATVMKERKSPGPIIIEPKTRICWQLTCLCLMPEDRNLGFFFGLCILIPGLVISLVLQVSIYNTKTGHNPYPQSGRQHWQPDADCLPLSRYHPPTKPFDQLSLPKINIWWWNSPVKKAFMSPLWQRSVSLTWYQCFLCVSYFISHKSPSMSLNFQLLWAP